MRYLYIYICAPFDVYVAMYYIYVHSSALLCLHCMLFCIKHAVLLVNILYILQATTASLLHLGHFQIHELYTIHDDEAVFSEIG